MGGLAGTLQGLGGVIGPALPKRKTLALIVVGFVVGLIWSYTISPTIYYDADPSNLRQEFQDEWIKLLADRYAGANRDVGQNIAGLMLYVDDPLGIIDRLISSPAEVENRAKLEAIRPFAVQVQAVAASAPEVNPILNIIPFIVGPIVVLAVSAVLGLLWNLIIYPLVEPTLRQAGLSGRRRGTGAVSDQQAAAEIQAIKDARQAQKTQASDFTTSTYGKPLMQKMSAYMLGRGQYDDSFSIEDENERFLGECGAGISENIGVGEPQKATAIEVWLFDKDDFVRTVTKVFTSQHAFNDPALRTRLEPKGDLVLAEPGAVVVLETMSLRLQARIVELEYGTGPLPPNSYFQKLTIELAAWRKEPGAVTAPTVPAPAAAYTPPPASAYKSPSAAPSVPISPPPAQVSPGSPRPFASPSARPAAPPLSPPPRSPGEDDDPFGGTGDFTPLAR